MSSIKEQAIWVRTSTKERVKALKVNPKETYDEVINRLIGEYFWKRRKG